MARSIGDALPPVLLRLLDGEDLPGRVGLTALLLTATDEGWPHLAMLSIGELLALDPRRLRLALWPRSTAAANLTRAGRLTLALVHDGAGYSIRARAGRRPDLTLAGGRQLAAFDLSVDILGSDVISWKLFFSDRQEESECGAFADSTSDLHLTAVGLNDRM